MNKGLIWITAGLAAVATLLAWHFTNTSNRQGEELKLLSFIEDNADQPTLSELDPVRPSGEPDNAVASNLDHNLIDVEPSIQWPTSVTPLAFVRSLESQELISEAGVNQLMLSWLETCSQVSLFSPNVGDFVTPGSRADLNQSLPAKCDEVLPESFNMANLEDSGAVHAEISSLRLNSSYFAEVQALDEVLQQGGRSEFANEATRLLAQAMDPGSIQAAINSLLKHGYFDSPLLKEYQHFAFLPNFTQMSNDVATVLFCERIGGCRGKEHPMVLQRCFHSALGCDQPVDIHDAIFQLTPPVDYEIYSALLIEARGLIALHRRKHPQRLMQHPAYRKYKRPVS